MHDIFKSELNFLNQIEGLERSQNNESGERSPSESLQSISSGDNKAFIQEQNKQIQEMIKKERAGKKPLIAQSTSRLPLTIAATNASASAGNPQRFQSSRDLPTQLKSSSTGFRPTLARKALEYSVVEIEVSQEESQSSGEPRAPPIVE